MIRRPIPWRPTARTGPRQGVAVDARTMKRIIAEAENPIVVAGPKVRHDPLYLELALGISKRYGAPIFATGGSIRAFAEKGVKARQIGLLQLVNRLLDPEWKVGKGRVDVAVFIGTEYAIANNVFSTLKNWGDVKTLSISPYFQPNATVSFGNTSEEIFKEYMEELQR
ncbi:MAG: CO dehydrogenase/acetyl-CoA synthase complex subunit epsilon [Methanobacteriota archaeon]|nr:MAG: CO dehydrogenase/acetyl-CoA synthase complex subunit epsilon [Euryarchaeota archaeon]